MKNTILRFLNSRRLVPVPVRRDGRRIRIVLQDVNRCIDPDAGVAVLCLSPVILGIVHQEQLPFELMISGTDKTTGAEKFRIDAVRCNNQPAGTGNLQLYEISSATNSLQTHIGRFSSGIILFLKNVLQREPSNLKLPVSALNQLFTFYISLVPVYFLKKDSNDATKQPLDLCLRAGNVFYFSLIRSGRLISLLEDGDTICAGKVVCDKYLKINEMVEASSALDFKAKIISRYELGSHSLFISEITEEFSNDKVQLGFTPWFNKQP